MKTHQTIPMLAVARIVEEHHGRQLLDLTYALWDGEPALLDPETSFGLFATLEQIEALWRLDTVHREALRWSREWHQIDDLHRDAVRWLECETWCEKHNIGESAVVEQLKRDDDDAFTGNHAKALGELFNNPRM